MSKHHHQTADCAPTPSGDNSQGSIWNQLTNNNFNALDLMKEASGYLKQSAQDYHALSVINKDEKHIQNQNKHDRKAISWLGEDAQDHLEYAHHEIGEAGKAGRKAARDTAKGNFRHAAGENQYASNELIDASKSIDHAIADRTRQNDLRDEIAANLKRKEKDEAAYKIIRTDAVNSSRTGSAELRIANIFHELGLG